MAHKVLNLLWNLAHSDDVPVDIMDLALSAHIKILDYSCSQVRRCCFLSFCYPSPSVLGWLRYRIVSGYSSVNTWSYLQELTYFLHVSLPPLRCLCQNFMDHLKSILVSLGGRQYKDTGYKVVVLSNVWYWITSFR